MFLISVENGEVIVGYGIEEKYRNMRESTEDLKGLVERIFKNPKAEYEIGETKKVNTPSHKVLKI